MSNILNELSDVTRRRPGFYYRISGLLEKAGVYDLVYPVSFKLSEVTGYRIILHLVFMRPRYSPLFSSRMLGV